MIPTISLKRLSVRLLSTSVLFLSIQCFAGDRLDKEAQENADRFFEYIINGDFVYAYKYTSGSVSYRSEGMSKIASIIGKKEFIDKSDELFNKPFRDVLRKANNFTVECCLSSSYVWTVNDVYIWFDGDGTPSVIVNPYMIEPSFNCSKAQTEVEKAICQSLPLANQDHELKAIFDEAKVLLTGQEYKKLKSEQISFIRSRKSCGHTESCIIKSTDKRIRHLGKLIENERQKLALGLQNGIEDINGLWKSVRYESSGRCSNESDEEIATNEDVEVYINYPSILKTIRNVEGTAIQQHCKIHKVHPDTFAKVYFRTAYLNSYWGSCGGDIFNLSYAGRYILLELSSMNVPESNCGFIVITGHEEESSKLIYGDYLVDDILLSSGFVLENVK